MNEYDCKKLMIGTGASACKTYEALRPIVEQGIQSGITCFDTAPSYHTEKILGQILNECIRKSHLQREDIYIQTKIDAWQMQEMHGQIQKYVEYALMDMGFDYFDCLLIHWPIPEYFDETWRTFCQLRASGVVRKIGICNVRMWNLKKLAAFNTLPEVIQIERHPLRICEKEIAFCKEYGMAVQAYSPLCKMPKRLVESRELDALAKKYHKSIGQIILRWHLDTGVSPIFTSTKPERIREYADIDDFRLTAEDIAVVSSHNENWKLYLEGMICPGL